MLQPLFRSISDSDEKYKTVKISIVMYYLPAGIKMRFAPKIL